MTHSTLGAPRGSGDGLSTESAPGPEVPHPPTGSRPAAEGARRPPRRRRWLRYATAGILALCLLGVWPVLNLLGTDSVMFGPGSLHATEGLITFSGKPPAGLVFDPVRRGEGEVLFPTVSVTDRASLWDTWIRSSLDDTLTFEARDQVYPQGDKKAVDHVNEQAMEDSKTVATVVALRLLGQEVRITGAGARVEETMAGFGAQGVLRVGDIVVAVDGQRVGVVEDLTQALGRRKPGDKVNVEVERDGRRSTVVIALKASDDVPPRPLLGVRASTEDFALDLPVKVSFDSGDVTGPSAGLAWTLALIDRFTAGDLSRGRDVVATGTVDSGGAVGPIGGLVQKASAAARAGADVFLVPQATPEQEIRAARAETGGQVEVIPVASVSEALDALARVTGAPPVVTTSTSRG